MGGCSVAYCRNRFVRGSKHFFRFPKDWRRELWMKFTMRKGFEPKGSSTICEDHFSPDTFQKKKDRTNLDKKAVPTIIVRDSQRFEIRFDTAKNDYIDEDFEQLKSFAPPIQIETEEDIFNQKQSRLDELRDCCRFCFSADGEKVEMEKLKSYAIEPDDVMQQLEVGEGFSDFLCEQCFQQIVQYDAFKKKVKENHQEILAEIQEFDEKITEISNIKFEVVPLDSTVEVLEEHLIDEEFIGEEVEYIEEIVDLNDVSMLEDGNEKIEAEEVDFVEEYDTSLDDRDGPVQGVDEYEMVTTDDIIKNPERNRFCFRIYECFFCKMKFAGRKTFIAHKCSVTEIQCEKCDKTFNKLQAYNSHLSHVHGSLPTQKNCCPICKTVIVATLNQFKAHRRNCNKRASNQTIECEICQKVCNNLKGYTIHKLFHETRNYTTSTGEKIARNGLNVFKGKAVCELCGKEFNSQSGYRMHRRNVHRIGYEGETFPCQMCPKTCPTRRSLFDHVRNTHRVQETPCNVCGKIFRTKILLKKHMMYHDETKRIWFCNDINCRDKPGYYTKVALTRHLKSHSGKKDHFCSECGSGFTSKNQLKIHSANKHGITL